MNHVASNATPLPEQQVKLVHQALRPERPEWNRMMVEKNLPERLRPLEELAHNLWWCWNPGAWDLFEEIDPDLWNRSERNPIAFLDLLTINRLKELERDESFLASLDAVYAQFKSYMSEKPDPATPKIAYFSMEYGLHASLKIYSGGLGILAGDYLKEASDKNVPMVAVGLLYRYGYFTQKLSAQGLSRRLTKHRTSRSCRSSPCAMRWATGRPCRFPCRDVRSRPASGFAGWDVPTCTCSTPITRPISRRIAG